MQPHHRGFRATNHEDRSVTSGGPEAGWMFDPEDTARERYWNGVAWTEHRRAASLAEQMPAANSQTQDSGVETASAEPLLAGPSSTGDELQDQTGVEEGTFVDQPGSSESTSRPVSTAPLDHPSVTLSELAVGGQARVMSGDKRYLGRVGRIVSTDSHHVSLRFMDSMGSFDFPRSHLEAIQGPALRLDERAAVLSTGKSTSPPLRRMWDELPLAGRIGVVAIPGIAVWISLIILGNSGSSNHASSATSADSTGSSDSYAWGERAGNSAVPLVRQGGSFDSACQATIESGSVYADDPVLNPTPPPKNFNIADAQRGCLDQLHKRLGY
jgi:hypothetical protein